MCPQEHGDYKICFDNTFSYLSSKTVYFEILNENEDEDYDELRDIFGEDEEVDAEYYEVSVAEIEVGEEIRYRKQCQIGEKWCKIGKKKVEEANMRRKQIISRSI